MLNLSVRLYAMHCLDVAGEHHCGLTVYPLRDVLSRVSLPPSCPLDGVSTKWRCVIAPMIREDSATDGPEEETLRFLDAGIPCRLGRWRSEPVYTTTGTDGVAFLTDPRWNEFPKPKIAFKSGWAGPGTRMESPDYHQLITSFSRVFEHEAPDIPSGTAEAVEGVGGEEMDDDSGDDVEVPDLLDLQVFHRQDDSICPPIPVLAEKLVWPMFLEDGAICENATRVSQRGTVMWWHIDDSGEFVEQTALPLKSTDSMVRPPSIKSLGEREQFYYAKIDKELYGENEKHGSVPVKLFLYGPRSSYDWFMHDDESATSGKVAALNIFSTPDEALPKDPTLLPIIYVTVLESGGRPLISPPNLPHMIISLNDCIVVEQRRVAHLFLEEISYFLQKCAFWSGNPIVYDYVDNDLQDETYVAGQLVPMLMDTFAVHNGFNPYDEIIRRRIVTALFTIAAHEKHYNLSEDSRRSLHTLLHGENEEMTAVLQQPYGPWRIPLEQYLLNYWDVRQCWPKPGCVFRAPLVTAPHLLSAKCREGSASGWFLPVVYASSSSPVYGSEKNSVEEVSSEYFLMAKIEKKHHELLALLRTRKGEKDSLLDELF